MNKKIRVNENESSGRIPRTDETKVLVFCSRFDRVIGLMNELKIGWRNDGLSYYLASDDVELLLIREIEHVKARDELREELLENPPKPVIC